jgi:hypothetical protein
MAKRRMPAHIVLPNGMWRFVKRGAKKARAKRAKRRGVVRMAKRGKKRGSFGSKGSLMTGIVKPKGIIEKVLVSIGAASATRTIIGEVHPLQNAGVGFLTGGIVGAGACYFQGQMKQGTLGGLGLNASNNSGVFY